MVKLKLLKKTVTEVVYAYYPEGKEAYGIISYNLKTKEPTLLKDDGVYTSEYRGHAYHKIMEYDENGHFEEEGMSAWY